MHTHALTQAHAHTHMHTRRHTHTHGLNYYTITADFNIYFYTRLI